MAGCGSMTGSAGVSSTATGVSTAGAAARGWAGLPAKTGGWSMRSEAGFSAGLAARGGSGTGSGAGCMAPASSAAISSPMPSRGSGAPAEGAGSDRGGLGRHEALARRRGLGRRLDGRGDGGRRRRDGARLGFLRGRLGARHVEIEAEGLRRIEARQRRLVGGGAARRARGLGAGSPGRRKLKGWAAAGCGAAGWGASACGRIGASSSCASAAFALAAPSLAINRASCAIRSSASSLVWGCGLAVVIAAAPFAELQVARSHSYARWSHHTNAPEL
jgi:hypothetical protein